MSRDIIFQFHLSSRLDFFLWELEIIYFSNFIVDRWSMSRTPEEGEEIRINLHKFITENYFFI